MTANFSKESRHTFCTALRFEENAQLTHLRKSRRTEMLRVSFSACQIYVSCTRSCIISILFCMPMTFSISLGKRILYPTLIETARTEKNDNGFIEACYKTDIIAWSFMGGGCIIYYLSRVINQKQDF